MPIIDNRIIEALRRQQLVTEYIIYPFSDITDYQIKLTNVPSFSKNDVLVIANKKILPHWVESKGNVWTKIPKLIKNTPLKIYTLTGNAAASDGGNIGNTFVFGDDFNSDTLNPTWTFVQSGAGGDSYSLVANPGKIRITGSKQQVHTPITLLKRLAPGDTDYIQEVVMTGVWDANYKVSGLYVGNGGVVQADDRIVGQIMHESSGTPHTYVWIEKYISSTRTYDTGVRFTEPTADVLISFTKIGINFSTKINVGGNIIQGITLPYTSTTTNVGIVINNDDNINTFTADFDNYRVRKYVANEPIVKKVRTLNKSLLLKELMR